MMILISCVLLLGLSCANQSELDQYPEPVAPTGLTEFAASGDIAFEGRIRDWINSRDPDDPELQTIVERVRERRGRWFDGTLFYAGMWFVLSLCLLLFLVLLLFVAFSKRRFG